VVRIAFLPRAPVPSDFGLRASFGFRISAFGFPRIAAVRQQREHEEERAQHVLPFRHPGDGFHVQGMQREQRRHKSAAPPGAGQALQQEKEQQGVGQVKGQVHQVRRAGAQPEPLAVEHVRQGGEGLPIAQVMVLKGPDHTRPAQPAANSRVADDAVQVVVVEELELAHRPIHRQRGG
jgi:hypothetical protein